MGCSIISNIATYVVSMIVRLPCLVIKYIYYIHKLLNRQLIFLFSMYHLNALVVALTQIYNYFNKPMLQVAL